MKKPLFESKAIPVKIDSRLLARIDAVAERLQEPRSTIMRMAMRLGIEAMEKLHAETDPVRYDELKGEPKVIYPKHQDQISKAEDKPSKKKKAG